MNAMDALKAMEVEAKVTSGMAPLEDLGEIFKVSTAPEREKIINKRVEDFVAKYRIPELEQDAYKRERQLEAISLQVSNDIKGSLSELKEFYEMYEYTKDACVANINTLRAKKMKNYGGWLYSYIEDADMEDTKSYANIFIKGLL